MWAVTFETTLGISLQFEWQNQTSGTQHKGIIEIAQQCPQPSRIRESVIIGESYDFGFRLT
jgi:hypothetical protein